MDTLSNFPSVTEAIFFSERLSAQSPTHKQIRDISYKLERCLGALMDEITYLEIAQDFSAYYHNCWKAHKNISDYLTEAFLDKAENDAMLCGEDIEFDDEGNPVYPIHPAYLTSDDELPF